MGHPISTGFSKKDHEISFLYEGEDKQQRCFMVCKCGWKIEIQSFRHPWSLVEIKVKRIRHIRELGLSSNE